MQDYTNKNHDFIIASIEEQFGDILLQFNASKQQDRSLQEKVEQFHSQVKKIHKVNFFAEEQAKLLKTISEISKLL